MKWIKRGLVFDPALHPSPDGAREFAQSPQALVCADHVRVYFSTRSRDAGGKFLSHIAYADFDPAMEQVLGTSSGTVIALGRLGAFDEHGIFPIHVLRDGQRILAFTSGWSRRVSVSVETSIGLAQSHDGGTTFTRFGDGPVLTSSLHEPCLVGDPFVIIHDGLWHMWYIYGARWIAGKGPGDPPERIYKIVHATSHDGVGWEKEGRQLIDDRLDAQECQALPTVFEHGGAFHMYFCYREATDFRTNHKRGYRLGYASSHDLVHWARNDELSGIALSPTGWDSEMMCYPHVFSSRGRTFMLYNGNQFGRSGFGLARLEPGAAPPPAAAAGQPLPH